MKQNFRMKGGSKQKLNIFLIAAISLLVFASLYYFYKSFRNSQEIYVEVAVVRGQNAAYSTGSSLYSISLQAVPVWLSDSISLGDTDGSPLGGVNAEVIGKMTLEGPSSYRFVTLLVRVNSVKDRSGVYLYKNKSLLVGSVLELNLSRTKVYGLVTGINEDKTYEKDLQELNVVVQGRFIEPFIAQKIEVGDKITDDQGNVLGEILEFRQTRSPVSPLTYSNYAGKTLLSPETDAVDIEVKIRLKAGKIGENYYFFPSQKVKAGESIYLPFKKVSLYYPISGIENASQ